MSNFAPSAVSFTAVQVSNNWPCITRVNELKSTNMYMSQESGTCPTCSQHTGYCRAHRGYIRLPIDVFNYAYNDAIVELLNMLCPQCCYPKLRFSTKLSNYNKARRQRMQESLTALFRSTLCSCGYNGKIQESLHVSMFKKMYKNLGYMKITKEEYSSVLLEAFNIGEQQDMLTDKIPVIPYHILQQIPGGKDVLSCYTQLLSVGVRNSDKRPKDTCTKVSELHKKIVSILTHKPGVIRQMCVPRESPHFVRAVITPDPYIRVSDVSIPKALAYNFTEEVSVTNSNLYKCVRNIIDGNANYLVYSKQRYKLVSNNVCIKYTQCISTFDTTARFVEIYKGYRLLIDKEHTQYTSNVQQHQLHDQQSQQHQQYDKQSQLHDQHSQQSQQHRQPIQSSQQHNQQSQTYGQQSQQHHNIYIVLNESTIVQFLTHLDSGASTILSSNIKTVKDDNIMNSYNTSLVTGSRYSYKSQVSTEEYIYLTDKSIRTLYVDVMSADNSQQRIRVPLEPGCKLVTCKEGQDLITYRNPVLGAPSMHTHRLVYKDSNVDTYCNHTERDEQRDIYEKFRRNIEIGPVPFSKYKDDTVLRFEKHDDYYKLRTMCNYSVCKTVKGSDYTMSINESCTGSYKADFDGDEMATIGISQYEYNDKDEDISIMSDLHRGEYGPTHDAVYGLYLLTHDYIGLRNMTRDYLCIINRLLHNRTRLDILQMRDVGISLSDCQSIITYYNDEYISNSNTVSSSNVLKYLEMLPVDILLHFEGASVDNIAAVQCLVCLRLSKNRQNVNNKKAYNSFMINYMTKLTQVNSSNVSTIQHAVSTTPSTIHNVSGSTRLHTANTSDSATLHTAGSVNTSNLVASQVTNISNPIILQVTNSLESTASPTNNTTSLTTLQATSNNILVNSAYSDVATPSSSLQTEHIAQGSNTDPIALYQTVSSSTSTPPTDTTSHTIALLDNKTNINTDTNVTTTSVVDDVYTESIRLLYSVVQSRSMIFDRLDKSSCDLMLSSSCRPKQTTVSSIYDSIEGNSYITPDNKIMHRYITTNYSQGVALGDFLSMSQSTKENVVNKAVTTAIQGAAVRSETNLVSNNRLHDNVLYKYKDVIYGRNISSELLYVNSYNGFDEKVDLLGHRIAYKESQYIDKQILAIMSLSVKYGQLKLLLSEIEFLTMFNSYLIEKHSKLIDARVVYAGAAPGAHIPVLRKLFKNLRFFLFDKSKFSDNLHINATDGTRKERKRIHIHRTYVSEHEANLFKSNTPTAFISDIRTNKYGADHPSEEDVMTNNALNVQLVQAMQPDMSMLKFLLPYTPGSTTLFDGELFYQCWCGATSAESRLVCKKPYVLKEYDHTTYEQVMYCHNLIRGKDTKPTEIVQPLLGIMREYKIVPHYDIYRESLIIRRYSEQSKMLIHKVYNIMRDCGMSNFSYYIAGKTLLH